MKDKTYREAARNKQKEQKSKNALGMDNNDVVNNIIDNNNKDCEILESIVEKIIRKLKAVLPLVKISVGAIALIAVICAVVFYIYPTYIEDHPIESIDVEVSPEMNAGMEYWYPVTITPSNASDKGLMVECKDPSISVKIERSRLYITVGDFVSDGKKITILLQSNKYDQSYKELSFIVKNDLTMKVDSTASFMSAGETVIVNASFSRPIDTSLVWTCDNSNIKMEEKGNSVELYAPYDGWNSKVTNIIITGTVPNTSYSCSYTIKVYADYELSFKKAPSGDLNIGGAYAFELNLPQGYDSSKIQWKVSGTNVSLSENTGSHSTLTVSEKASLGSTVKVEVFSESFGTITKTFRIDDVIRLSTPDQVKAIMNHPSAKFELMNDIDVGTIMPLGDTGSGAYGSFSGDFNGNGHTITYKYNSKAHMDNNVGYAGLFAKLKDAKVYNLHVNANISLGNSSDRYKVVCAGGLAGSASGSEIYNVECTLTMRSPGKDVDYLAGGLVGKCCDSKVMIRSCTLNVDLSVTGGTAHAGGVFGRNENTTVDISDTIVKGSVYAKGGLAGGYGSAGGIGGHVADKTTTNITGCDTSECGTSSADGGFGGNHKTGAGVARISSSATVATNK